MIVDQELVNILGWYNDVHIYIRLTELTNSVNSSNGQLLDCSLSKHSWPYSVNTQLVHAWATVGHLPSLANTMVHMTPQLFFSLARRENF